MNFIVRVLRNTFLIAVIAVMVLGYIYREDLFPGLFHDNAGDTSVVVNKPTDESGDSKNPETTKIAQIPVTAEVAQIPVPAGTTQMPVPAEVAQIPVPAGTTQMPVPAEVAQIPVPAGTVQMPVPARTAQMPGSAGTVQMPVPTGTAQMPVPAGTVQTPVPADVAPQASTNISTTITSAAPESTSAVQKSVKDAVISERSGKIQYPASPQAASGITQYQGMNPNAQTAVPPMSQNNRSMQQRINPEQEKAAKMFKLLADARQAFWLKKYEEAEKYYHSIIVLEPDNPDLSGEIGNFYYAQGKWDQAADSYYKCALSLLNARRFGQAVYISKIVRGLNKDLADKLDTELNEIRKTK